MQILRNSLVLLLVVSATSMANAAHKAGPEPHTVLKKEVLNSCPTCGRPWGKLAVYWAPGEREIPVAFDGRPLPPEQTQVALLSRPPMLPPID